MHYFNAYAAGGMGGRIPTTFWSRTVLQRCQHEAPVRHAAAALGQLYMEYKAAPRACVFLPEHTTVKLYGRALASLRRYIDISQLPDRSLVLMCSASFFCFELLRGGRDAASSHLESALKILNRWQNEVDTASTNLVGEHAELLAVFARMDLEATLIEDSRKPVLKIDISEFNDGRPLTLEKIQKTLFPLVHSAFVFLVDNNPNKGFEPQSAPTEAGVRRGQLLDQLYEWDTMADKFEQSAAMRSPVERPNPGREGALAICRLHCGVVRLLLQHWLNDNIRAAAPSFDNQAGQLLTWAETAILLIEDAQASTLERRFSPDTGVISPLFMLVVKVCNRSIRERALQLLQKIEGCREGFYDAATMIEYVAALRHRAATLGLQPDEIALEWMSRDENYVSDLYASGTKQFGIGAVVADCR